MLRMLKNPTENNALGNVAKGNRVA